MERISFIFTICFVLLGPIKIIPAFAELTSDEEPDYKRRLALFGTLVAAAICLFILLLGRTMVGSYEISLPSIQLGGGLVLLLSALRMTFPSPASKAEKELAKSVRKKDRSAFDVAVGTLSVPIIVTPAGIAALLIFILIAPKYPGMYQALFIVLPIVLLLDYLVMRYNARLLRLPGLISAIRVLGFVLTFIQVALAIEAMISGLRGVGAIPPA